jgi:hypothetical protein
VLPIVTIFALNSRNIFLSNFMKYAILRFILPILGLLFFNNSADATAIASATLPMASIDRVEVPHPLPIEEHYTTPGSGGERIQTDGFAIAGFITGVFSLFVAGLVFGILGVVFGVVAYNRIRAKSTRKGRGLAIAGIVLGAIGIVGALIIFSRS